jgi:fucose 4-O-acetylase-like acetyltransferase
MQHTRVDGQVTRIDWIDVAKGYGILFVIFAHLGVGPIGTWIYTFHMPLFFFLSGYVFSTKYDFKTFVRRKCKSIIVPYFSLGTVMVIFQILLNYHAGTGDIYSSLHLVLRLIVQRRFWTLWYIACLFFLNIVFYGLVKKFRTLKKLFLVVIMMFVVGLLYYHFGGVALPWNVDVVLTSSIFFFAGYWFKSNYGLMRDYISRNRSIFLFIVMGFINVCFGFLGIKIAGRGMEMFGSSYGFPPFTVLSAFAGIICVVIFSHWFNVGIIKYLGRNSMIYYAWHQTIMIPVVRFALNRIGISSAMITNDVVLLGERMLELLIIVALSTVCHMVISRTKLRFMIGQ